MKKESNEIKSLAHSKDRCQYHIVFAPKYRRKVIYGKLRKDIGEILRKLCEQKNAEIIEAEAYVDHIHMLVSIPPYISIAQFMGYIKGKSSLMIFVLFPSLIALSAHPSEPTFIVEWKVYLPRLLRYLWQVYLSS